MVDVLGSLGLLDAVGYFPDSARFFLASQTQEVTVTNQDFCVVFFFKAQVILAEVKINRTSIVTFSLELCQFQGSDIHRAEPGAGELSQPPK